MTSKQLGILGEKIALGFLQKKRYRVLDRNYLPKFLSGPQRGEIDIIAKPRRSVFDILRSRRNRKDDIIHFIEVKTLRQAQGESLAEARGGRTSAISPEEKVDFLKQRKIIKMAEFWLMEKKIPFTAKWQIDVIAIQIDLDSKKAKIRFFENAVCQTCPHT